MTGDEYDLEHGEPQPSKFCPVDLSAVLDKLPERPPKINPLVYAARVHMISGQPEAGKSTIAWSWMLREVGRGHPVVCIDNEAGAQHTADLLRSFGTDREAIKRLVHYFPDPDVSWHSGDIEDLHAMCADVRPRIIFFDSAVSLLEQAQLSENAATDVRRLYRRLLLPLPRRFGASVIVADHDSKDGLESRYSRGSTDKLAVAEVTMKVATVEPFNRDTDGIIELLVTKDRPGTLHRSWRIKVTRNPLALHWAKTRRPRAAGTRAAGTRAAGGGTPAAESVAQAMDQRPRSIKELVDRIVAAGRKPLKYDTAYRALNWLMEQGRADRVDQDAGMPVLWMRPGGVPLRAVPDDDPTPEDPGPNQPALGDD